MEFGILGGFLTYIQFWAAVNFALLFIDKGSLVQKFQKKLLDWIKSNAKPVMNAAGSVTKRCREDSLKKSGEGLLILGKANEIRDLKRAFNAESDVESWSSFLPAMGVMSGGFCIVYMVLVPLLMETKDHFWLYILEYTVEAVLASEIMALYALRRKYMYIGSLLFTSLWFMVVIAFALILHSFDAVIQAGSVELYYMLFVAAPAVPVATMIIRLLCLSFRRVRRKWVIQDKAKKLAEDLDAYRGLV